MLTLNQRLWYVNVWSASVHFSWKRYVNALELEIKFRWAETRFIFRSVQTLMIATANYMQIYVVIYVTDFSTSCSA